MSVKEQEQGPGSPLPLSLLLVEDSPDDVFFFTRILRKSNLFCELTHASDGGEAIRTLKTSLFAAENPGRLPDLVFLDLKMPVLNGFDVLGWVKEQEFIPPIPIFVLSGSDDEGDRRKARDLGASDYLVKPITMETLLRCVKMVRDPSPLNPAEPAAGKEA